MEFDFNDTSRAGVIHQTTEALLRLSTNGADDEENDVDFPVLAIPPQSHEKTQNNCSCQDSDN